LGAFPPENTRGIKKGRKERQGKERKGKCVSRNCEREGEGEGDTRELFGGDDFLNDGNDVSSSLPRA
jgi:hypothetical protein